MPLSLENSSVVEGNSASPCTLVIGAPSPAAMAVAERLSARGDAVVVLGEVPGDQRSGAAGDCEWLAGDPGRIDWGLPGEDYLRLAARATRVVYAAEHKVGVTQLERSSAVRSAVELLEFVQAGGGRHGVVFLSSLLALGSPPQPAREGELQIGQSFFSKYEESLAVAESVVDRVAPLAPLMVLRTAPLSGWLASGALCSDAPLARLARRLQLSAPAGEIAYRDEPIRFECIETAVDGLIRLLDSGVPRTIHLADRVPLTDRALIDFLIAHYGRQPHGPAAVPFRTRMTLPDVVASHSVLGWRSRFDFTEAEKICPDLLDRDPMERLRRFFPPLAPPPPASPEATASPRPF